MRKRRETKSEATARAFRTILAALDRYWRHDMVGTDDMQRMLAAVVAHRQHVKVSVRLNSDPS